MISFSVLGCGRIGRMHAANLRSHPGATLVSVFDVMEEAANATASALGVRRAASIAEVMTDTSVQAVLIATPTDTHVPLVVEAARAGKAILCEKPIDLDMERVRRCQADIAAFDPLVMIGFNRRFDPSFAALRRRVEAGEIGRLEQVIITSRDPAPPPAQYVAASGGLFRDMMIHDFDMARSLVGNIVEVQAAGAVLIDPNIGTAGDVDAAMVTLRAASGALVHINNSRRCAYGYDQRLEAFGEKGMLLAGNRRETTVEAHLADRTLCQDPVLQFFIQRYSDAYAAEISHFVAAVQARMAPTPGFEDGVQALRLADAATESSRTGRIVRLD
jgi:myo-inositol 2-dehydrogenase/D-chiro-inositol 1-dehydrogenase